MRIVAALGGNALLERGEPPESRIQEAHVISAVQALAPLAAANELIITHGNGPQVGLLALESAHDPALTQPYPFDVLGAQTQGMIGYWLTGHRTVSSAVSRQPSAVSPVTTAAIGLTTGTAAEPATHSAVSLAGSRDCGWPALPPGTDPIGALTEARHATVQGRLQATKVQPAGQGTVLNWRIADATGDLTALFYGRTRIAGAEPGSQIRLHGMVGIGSDGQPAMINPGYELVR